MEDKQITILGAPLDLGSSRRGVDMGPSAIRYSGLQERLERLGFEVEDSGDVTAQIPEVAVVQNTQARFLNAILASCSQIAAKVAEIARAGQFPVVLGGDHSIAMGTIAGLHSVHGQGGVVWVDAHGDLNSPMNSPSGNVHGMPLAACLGSCGFALEGFAEPPWLDPARVALVGVRALDPGEKDLVQELGLHVFTMSDIDRHGVPDILQEAVEIASGDGFTHLSLDVDACDPEIAPGVGTPIRGGFSYREAHLAMEMIAEADVLTSIEVVEVNPVLDLADETGILAVELVASALGASIL